MRHKGGTCLALFPEMAEKTGFRVPVHDPKGRLPRDALSWQAAREQATSELAKPA